jgi:hypothetical protein
MQMSVRLCCSTRDYSVLQIGVVTINDLWLHLPGDPNFDVECHDAIAIHHYCHFYSLPKKGASVDSCPWFVQEKSVLCQEETLSCCLCLGY